MLWNLVQIICVTSNYTGSFKAVDSGMQTEDRHMEEHRRLTVIYAVNYALPMLAVIYFVEAVVFTVREFRLSNSILKGTGPISNIYL